MGKELEFEFVDTKQKFLNVFLSKPMKDWYIQQRNGNNNLAKKIAHINKLRAAFGAWRRLMNESDADSDMPSLLDPSDSEPDEIQQKHPYANEYESDSDSDSDPAFDMKNAAKVDVSDYYVITVGHLLQRRGRATPPADVSGLAADNGNVSQVTADGGNVSQLAANLHTLAPVNDHTSSSTESRPDSTPLTDRPKGRLSVILER